MQAFPNGRNATQLLLVLCGTAMTAGFVRADEGAPDRTVMSRFLAGSSMQLRDMNADCRVSDVDVAMLLYQRAKEQYGPNMNFGDTDGNGVINGEDAVNAFAKMIRGSFGKLATIEGEVTEDDVVETVVAVVEADPKADVNFDGSKDGGDVQATSTHLGSEVSEFDVDRIAREAFEYVGVVHTYGVASFMAAACAPESHLEGVSNTWPADHPKWWPPNHLSSVSRSYDPPPGHSQYESATNPFPLHATETSRGWPPNHLLQASLNWQNPPPPPHEELASMYNNPPRPAPLPPHVASVSGTWPPGHTQPASDSWTPSHDQVVSRTYWPGHNAADSSGQAFPPMHGTYFSDRWTHGQALSAAGWPPNHQTTVSQSWGNHQTGPSAHYPPSHISYASQSWPGPQPGWPPNHTANVSRSWGEPAPGGWPVFPADHSWFTTIRDVVNPAIPRPRWPFPWPQPQPSPQ